MQGESGFLISKHDFFSSSSYILWTKFSYSVSQKLIYSLNIVLASLTLMLTTDRGMQVLFNFFCNISFFKLANISVQV